MTDAEMRLWFRLRPLRRDGLAFRRQSPVGRYILDFECRPAKLGIELDGAQAAQAENAAYDSERTVRGARLSHPALLKLERAASH